MNRRVSKRIRNKAIGIQLEWVKNLLNTEEADKVTHNNLQEMLPKQTHLWAHGQLYNSAFSLRHLMNNIKKIHRRDPKRSIWDIHLKDIQDVIKVR